MMPQLPRPSGALRQHIRKASSLLGNLPIEYAKPRAVVLAVQIPTDTVLDTEGALLVSRMPGVWLRTQKCEFDAEVTESARACSFFST